MKLFDAFKPLRNFFAGLVNASANSTPRLENTIRSAKN